MAEQAPFQASSTFPNPPDFLWHDFTPEKIARFDEAKKTWLENHPEAAVSKAAVRIPDLPEDLRHLQPPPEPTDGTWRVLGGLWALKDELPTLEESGIQRLGPVSNGGHPNSTIPADVNRERALNLKRLAKSALLNFLELVGVASINPDGVAEKADDIETILINMHNGINEYRPHQARESLIQTMQDRLDKIRAETAAVNAVTDKARRVLEGLGSIDAPEAERDLKKANVNGATTNGGTSGTTTSEDSDEVWGEADSFV